MKRVGQFLRVAAPVIAAAIFVVTSSRAMPAKVASHFGRDGAANGYMWRHTYVYFMLAFVVLLPLFFSFVSSAVARVPVTMINIPNRDYWLAPERRGPAIDRLRGQMQIFSAMLVVFLCFVHWEVVRANQSLPPMLDNGRFMLGLGLFMAALIVWIVSLRRQFRVPAAKP
jgi:uncharacterized membrane protein